MIVGIILAAGKGKRFESKSVNKTAVKYLGKPLVLYGVELFESMCQKIFVVVGHAENSVRNSLLFKKDIIYVRQESPLGTGDALKKAVDVIKRSKLKPSCVLVGYGDHMMFYDNMVMINLLKLQKQSLSVVTIITTRYSEPDKLVWGRVIRNSMGMIEKIVEQKDADETERKITEINAGLYCFDWDFLEKEIYNLKASPITGEYYLTDLIGMAINKGLTVAGLEIPFEKVGIGINTKKEKEESENLYRSLKE